jgi:UDP-sugar transporter A1/2/3
LTTALFSVILLGKTLSKLKWVSLVMLTVGIGLVQISTNTADSHNSAQNSVQGLVAVLAACILSGMAGVYFEKLLKAPNSGNRSKIDDFQEKGKANSISIMHEDAQLWIRSLQLSIWSTFLALFLTVIWKDGKQVVEHGVFWNFTPIVWLLVATHALGGIIVGIVVKYADNILKGFATSMSIILSTALSVWLLNFSITSLFVLGTTLVVSATYLYSL